MSRIVVLFAVFAFFSPAKGYSNSPGGPCDEIRYTTNTVDLFKQLLNIRGEIVSEDCLNVIDSIYMSQESANYHWMVDEGVFDKFLAEGLTTTVCYYEKPPKARLEYHANLYGVSLILYLDNCVAYRDSSRLAKNLPLISPAVFESHVSALCRIKDAQALDALSPYKNSPCAEKKIAAWAGIITLKIDAEGYDRTLAEMESSCTPDEQGKVFKLVEKFQEVVTEE